MILEPQDAVAASICSLARIRTDDIARNAVGSRHPAECGWCAYPRRELIRWIEAFNEDDLIRGSNPDLPASHRLAGAFMRLPKDRQRALVNESMYGQVTA